MFCGKERVEKRTLFSVVFLYFSDAYPQKRQGFGGMTGREEKKMEKGVASHWLASCSCLQLFCTGARPQLVNATRDSIYYSGYRLYVDNGIQVSVYHTPSPIPPLPPPRLI
jgi:hypothetical protein